MPARPDYTQVEPSSEPVEYQWVVVGKDQVMIHPTATHDLMLEMSQHGHFSRPHAKGTLHLFDNWEAHFELLSSNMNLDLVRKALKKAAKQHGWDFKGLIDEDGLPHSEKVTSVKMAMPYQNNVWYHVTHRDRLRSIRDHGLTPTDRGNADKNWDEYSIITGGVYLSPNISSSETYRQDDSLLMQQTGWRGVDSVILRITQIDQRRLHPDPEEMTFELEAAADYPQYVEDAPELEPIIQKTQAAGGFDKAGQNVWTAYSALAPEQQEAVRQWWQDIRRTGAWVYLGTIPAQFIEIASFPGEEAGEDWETMTGISTDDLASESIDDDYDEYANQYKYRPLMGKVAADFGNGPINPGVKDYRNREWAGTDQWDQMPPPGWDDSPDESHPNHGPYECSECGEHFPDYGAWRQHVSDMHTSVPSRDEDAKPLINNDATFPPKLMDWSRVQDQAGVVAGWREAGMTRKKLLEYKDQLDDRLGKPTDEVVHQFDDGWTIRKPLREGDLAHAGCLMGNCMKNLTMESGYADTPINEPSIHTLNDPEGLPHVMWNYTPGYAVEDTEGRHGAPVKDAYKPYLTEWGKQEGINGFYEIDGQPIYTKDERVTPELDEAGDNEMVDLIEHKYPESEQSERAHDEYMRGIADEHFRDQHEIHNSIAGTHDQDGKTYYYTSDGHVFMREPAAGQQDADRYPEGLMYMPAHQYPSEMYHTMADKGVLPDRLRRNIDISRDSGLFAYDPSNKLHRLYMQQAGELNLTPEEGQQVQQMRQNGLDEAQIKSVIETLRARQDRLAANGWVDYFAPDFPAKRSPKEQSKLDEAAARKQREMDDRPHPDAYWHKQDTPDSLMQYAEMVPIEHLLPALEWDRRPNAPKIDWPGGEQLAQGADQDYWDVLKNHIAQNGILSPIYLDYDPKTGRAHVSEGNHRIRAAQELGHTHVPVIGYRSGRRSAGGHLQLAPWDKKDEFGYVAHTPQYLRPSDLGLPVREVNPKEASARD